MEELTLLSWRFQLDKVRIRVVLGVAGNEGVLGGVYFQFFATAFGGDHELFFAHYLHLNIFVVVLSVRSLLGAGALALGLSNRLELLGLLLLLYYGALLVLQICLLHFELRILRLYLGILFLGRTHEGLNDGLFLGGGDL